MMYIVMHFAAFLIVASVVVFGAALGEILEGRFHNGKSAVVAAASAVSFCLSLWWGMALSESVESLGDRNIASSEASGAQ